MLRSALVLGFLGALAWGGDGSSSRSPVIVELFTSEGCSSCPPADDLLARLQKSQPVPNAEIIALEEHVDYWNELGWPDPFSSSRYRERQNDYARIFQVDSVYTPQMVVNGQAGFSGSDSEQAYAQIGAAANHGSAAVRLSAGSNQKNSGLVDLTVRCRVKSGNKITDVYLAITEDNLSTEVRRGENGGRTLRHTAVVRSLGGIGKVDSSGEFHGTPTLQLNPAWKRQDLRAVVFVQERASRRILAAGSLRLR
jgi:hypothetical protein